VSSLIVADLGRSSAPNPFGASHQVHCGPDGVAIGGITVGQVVALLLCRFETSRRSKVESASSHVAGLATKTGGSNTKPKVGFNRAAGRTYLDE
jgi:hypothetical protein